MALILRVMCYFFLTQVDRHFSRKLEVNLLCHGPKIFATWPDLSWHFPICPILSVCLSVCLFVCLSVCEFCSYWDADTYKKSGLRYNLFTKQSWCPYFTPPHQEWGKIGWGIIRWGIIGGTLIIPENISYHYIWQY